MNYVLLRCQALHKPTVSKKKEVITFTTKQKVLNDVCQNITPFAIILLLFDEVMLPWLLENVHKHVFYLKCALYFLPGFVTM